MRLTVPTTCLSGSALRLPTTTTASRTFSGSGPGAGSGPADVVRVRYLLPNVDDFEACWPSLRRSSVPRANFIQRSSMRT